MKKITSFICFIFLIGFVSLTAASCKSLKEIPEDLTAPQILQRGQAYADASDYKNAEACYLATIDRYCDNTETYIEAKYELAHLYLKMKKYDKARTGLEEILEIYDYATPGSLPGAYKKLAQADMDKLPSRSVEE